MNRYTIVNNATNVIENIIIWDGEADLGDTSGYTLTPFKQEDIIGEQYTN